MLHKRVTSCYILRETVVECDAEILALDVVLRNVPGNTVFDGSNDGRMAHVELIRNV